MACAAPLVDCNAISIIGSITDKLDAGAAAVQGRARPFPHIPGDAPSFFDGCAHAHANRPPLYTVLVQCPLL